MTWRALAFGYAAFMLSRPTLSPRRTPRQVRSRRMVAAILEAAALVFVEVGYENASTNHIARRAGVSVGSLYQFFPNKGALLASLQSQWTERLGAALDEVLDREAERDLGALIDDVLDVHARLNAAPPGLLGLLLIAPALSPDGATVRATVQRRLEDILSRRAPYLGAARRAAVARMTIHIVGGLYAFGSTAGAADPTTRAEVRAALLAYLTPVLPPSPEGHSS